MPSNKKCLLLCLFLFVLLNLAASNYTCFCTELPQRGVIVGPPGSNGQHGQPGYNGQHGQPGYNGQHGQPGYNGQQGQTGYNGQQGYPEYAQQPPRPTEKPLEDEFDIKQVRGARVRISKNEKTWVEANGDCRAMGMKLLSLENRAKQDKFAQAFPGNTVYEMWTSGSDRDTESRFKWTSTEEFLADTGFQSWGTNQPDNRSGNEHCLMATFNFNGVRGNTKWFDESCDRRFKFICQ